MSQKNVRLGNLLWSKTPKLSSEFFSLTYGALVRSVIKEFREEGGGLAEVNKELRRMGSNIGIRLIDEYLSKTAYHSSSTDPSPPPTSSNSSSTNFNNGVCRSLNETAECIAKVGFKMFLGINVDVANFVDGPSGPEGTTFSLYIYQNPLAIFVELPSEGFDDLSYSEILCGVLEGSLSQVGLLVKCDMVRDVLKGDEVNEIRVYVRGRVKDDVGEGFKEE